MVKNKLIGEIRSIVFLSNDRSLLIVFFEQIDLDFEAFISSFQHVEIHNYSKEHFIGLND